MPIERRRKPSAARMAKRGFLRASVGRMPKRAAMERAKGRMPAASVRRDGRGLAPSVRHQGPCRACSGHGVTGLLGVTPRQNCSGHGVTGLLGQDCEGLGPCRSSRPWQRAKAGCRERAAMERAKGRMPVASVRRDGMGLAPSVRAQGPPSVREMAGAHPERARARPTERPARWQGLTPSAPPAGSSSRRAGRGPRRPVRDAPAACPRSCCG
jgi:hypothetical protein